jgi:hypothetical protein
MTTAIADTYISSHNRIPVDFGQGIGLRSLKLIHASGHPAIYHNYVVRAIENTPVSTVVIAAQKLKSDPNCWGRLDEAAMSALQPRDNDAQRAFNLTILTEDIESDRVQCPLQECVDTGIVRLVDAKLLRQMHSGLEKGTITRHSWYDHNQSVVLLFYRLYQLTDNISSRLGP